MLRDNEIIGGGPDATNDIATPTEKREDSSTTHDSSKTESITISDITATRRRLKRKLDIRLALWAFMGFFALFLDKSNLRMYSYVTDSDKLHHPWMRSLMSISSLANAYVSGMREDLNLESVAYNWADTIMSISLNV